MQHTTRETLELFAEKVGEIDNESFVAFYNEGRPHMSINFTMNRPVQVEFTIPPDESLKAMLTTLRLFIQQTEPTSLSNVAKVLSDPDISPEFKERMTIIRTDLNSFLDRVPHVSGQPAGSPLSYRVILDTFLNGHYFHLKDTTKRALYHQIKGHVMMQWAFRQTIEKVLFTAYELGRLIIAELESQPQ